MFIKHPHPMSFSAFCGAWQSSLFARGAGCAALFADVILADDVTNRNFINGRGAKGWPHLAHFYTT